MKKRAFTLVEIIITVFLIGLITVSVIPLFFMEMNKLNSSFKFTEAAFDAQAKIEGEIKKLSDIAYDDAAPTSTPEELNDKTERKTALENWSDDSALLKINLFDATKDVMALSKTVSTKKKDSVTGEEYERKILVVLPESKGYRGVRPEINVKLEEDGSDYKAKVTYKKKPKSSDTWENSTEFCVYRWYIGEFKGKYAYQLSDLTLIREFNLAKNEGNPREFNKALQLKNLKKPLLNSTSDYGSDTYNVIAEGPYVYLDGSVPLIKDKKSNQKTGDRFNVSDLNMGGKAEDEFNDREKSAFYGSMGLVFSAMPVSKSGEVGKEVFSEMKNLNISYDRLQLGYRFIGDAGTGLFKVSFLLKQMDKVDRARSYYFLVKNLDDGTLLYPDFDDDENIYEMSEEDEGKENLQTDSDGLKEFKALLRLGHNYEISIYAAEDDALLVSGNFSLIPTP